MENNSSRKISGSEKNTQDNTFQNFSNQVFNVRRVLIEQFNRIEKDLQSKFHNNQEKFATKEELYNVLGKMQEFRQEIEKTLNVTEENPLEPAADEFFTGLNPFNLRKNIMNSLYASEAKRLILLATILFLISLLSHF